MLRTLRDMGNSDSFRLTVGLIGLIMGAVLLMPHGASAAPPGFGAIPDIVKERLCERQEILGARLRVPFISPLLCNPTPPPAPELTFTSSPQSIESGTSATLSWTALNATSCTASGGWSGTRALSGSQIVTPSATTTYILTCTGVGGTAQKSATVAVVPVQIPAPTLQFQASSTLIFQGSSTLLSWTTQNAVSCTASNGWSGVKGISGSEVVSPTATTTYTLTCTGLGGDTTQSITINVKIPQPSAPTLSLQASSTNLMQGSSTQLTWVSTDATSCTASGGWSGNKSTSGTQMVTPNATTTYVLTCTGDGGSVQQSLTINVTIPHIHTAPTLSLQASSTHLMQGSSTQLTWVSTDVTSCVASNGWTGTKGTTGTEVVTPSATTTYTLECAGLGGTTSQSVTITITPHPIPVVVLTATPSSVLAGGTTTLTWSSTHASSCTAFVGWTGARPLSGSEVVTVAATTTYQLDCTGLGGVGSDDAIVAVTPTTTPAAGKLLITEVLYDLTNSTTTPQGEEPSNEWIELYNGTNASIDLGGYFIGDASSTDMLPSVLLPAGAYAVITATTTTASFWSIPGNALIIVLNSSIGQNGLGNDGDVVRLLDSASSTIDQLSYGETTSVFNPSIPDVPTNAGHSIARIDRLVDTNTALDWQADTSPSPGSN